MIIYNVTINVDDSAHKEWLSWMKETHIPDVLSTEKFTKALMTKVLVEEEMGGQTYSVQYTAPSREHLQAYYDDHADRLRNEGSQFVGKLVVFRTELEVISEH